MRDKVIDVPATPAVLRKSPVLLTNMAATTARRPYCVYLDGGESTLARINHRRPKWRITFPISGWCRPGVHRDNRQGQVLVIRLQRVAPGIAVVSDDEPPTSSRYAHIVHSIAQATSEGMLRAAHNEGEYGNCDTESSTAKTRKGDKIERRLPGRPGYRLVGVSLIQLDL